jgi:hypothetical protein
MTFLKFTHLNHKFMADTIITNTPDTSDNAMGGIVAVVIIAVLVAGGVLLYQTGLLSTVSDPANSDTTEINVTVPTPTPTPVPTPTGQGN